MRCHIYRKQNQSICETYSAEIKDFDSLRILGPLFMKVCNYYYSFTEVSTFRDQIKFSICVYEKTFPVINSNEQKIVHCQKSATNCAPNKGNIVTLPKIFLLK